MTKAAAMRMLHRAMGLIRELRLSGVELDDERLRYVAVQVDRNVWDEAAQLLREWEGE